MTFVSDAGNSRLSALREYITLPVVSLTIIEAYLAKDGCGAINHSQCQNQWEENRREFHLIRSEVKVKTLFLKLYSIIVQSPYNV